MSGGTAGGARDEIVVVGAGLAGLGAVRAVRALGYAGRLVLVGSESRPPYDRPPLSKQFLAGTMPPEDLTLVMPDDETLDVEVRLGETATALDVAGRTVRLASGESLGGRGVVIATGARARGLPGAAPAGVHTLRTVEDAVALRAELRADANVVVVGGGFIGAETAATARGLGADVTVVEAAAAPLALALGPGLATAVARMHTAHGVRLVTGTGVTGLAMDGGGRVRAVRLSDGRDLPADVVVVGIGAMANVGWLDGSGLDTVGGVLTDVAGSTGAPGIVAVGDCTRRFERLGGTVIRQEHWTNALQQPRLAAAVLLGAPPPDVRPVDTVPYVWSEQYGSRLQLAGCRRDGDLVEVVEGVPGEGPFVARYLRDGVPTAVVALDSPRIFGRLRRELAGVLHP